MAWAAIAAAALSLAAALRAEGILVPLESDEIAKAQCFAMQRLGAAPEAVGAPVESCGGSPGPWSSPATVVLAFAMKAMGPSMGALHAPFVVAGLVGLGAVVASVRAAAGLRAAAFAATILVTSPLYTTAVRAVRDGVFAHAGFALALAGLSFVSAPRSTTRSRMLALATAAAGVLLATWASHGGLGVVVPLAPLLVVRVTPRLPRPELRSEARSIFLGAVAGVVALAAGAWIASRLPWPALADPPLAPATVGRVWTSRIQAFVHGFAPYGALVPAAVALVLSPAGLARRQDEGSVLASTFARGCASALLLGLILEGASRAGPAPIVAFPAAAVLVALALEDLVTGREMPTLALLGTMALVVLVARDLVDVPVRTMAAWGLETNALPAGATRFTAIVTRLGVPLVVLSLGANILVRSVPRPLVSRVGGWFAFGPAVPWLPALAFVAMGIGLRVFVVERALGALAPSDVLAEHRKRAAPGEPVATLGLPARALPFAGRTLAARFENAAEARAWLEAAAPGTPRRWLVFAATEAAALEASLRATYPGASRHLGVLGPATSSTWLTSSSLLGARPGDEGARVPLAGTVLDEAPRGLMGEPTTFARGIEGLGYTVVGDDGAPLADVAPGRPFHVRLVYRAREPAPSGHCTFLHVDGPSVHVTREHRPEDMPYPMRFWQPGDVVLDDFVVSLPATAVRGAYAITYGFGVLPCTDARRLPVLRGPSDGQHRATAGSIEVRR